MRPVIDDDISEALRELQSSTGPNGKPEKIQIGSKSCPAFVSDIPQDRELFGGGEQDTAKFTAWILKMDHMTEPMPGTVCQVRGQSLWIINPITDKRSFWEVTIGDYSNE
jgi:hypothetical protein